MSVQMPLMPTPNDVALCLDWPRSTAQTSQGPVVYADRGTGDALLCVHGTPGGCDQGLLVAEFFRANGFRVLAPSRPGYLGTPLTSGRTPREQADLFAALLDAEQIEQIAVIGASGGGPSTYLLAAHHADRVSCLVQFSSVAMPWSQSAGTTVGDRVGMSRLGNDLLMWLFDHRPSLLDRLMGSPAGDHGQALREDPLRWAMLRTLIASAGGKPPRRAGYDNDLTQFANLATLPLSAIACPTLLVHGTADINVTPAHTDHASATIPGAEVRWIDQGSHIAWLIEDGAVSYRLALEFLTRHGCH